MAASLLVTSCLYNAAGMGWDEGRRDTGHVRVKTGERKLKPGAKLLASNSSLSCKHEFEPRTPPFLSPTRS